MNLNKGAERTDILITRNSKEKAVLAVIQLTGEANVAAHFMLMKQHTNEQPPIS